MDACAPIAIFAYNRPQHLQATLQSLSECAEWCGSRVILYSDGPRQPSDAAAVAAVREVAKSIDHPFLEVVEREDNLGLAQSIIRGVSEVCERFGRAIVVEDDLLVSEGFLGYLNRALNAYAKRADIFQVSAHMFDVPEFAERRATLLLPMTTTWGWATWRRAWRHFAPDAPGWERLRADGACRKRFNLENHYNYYSMLQQQMTGKRDSWGIRWYWTVFAADGLSCFPPRSLVRNTGMDGSGTHGRGALRRFGSSDIGLPDFDIEVPTDAHRCSDWEFSAVQRAIWRKNGGWRGWVADLAKTVIGRIQAAVTSTRA